MIFVISILHRQYYFNCSHNISVHRYIGIYQLYLYLCSYLIVQHWFLLKLVITIYTQRQRLWLRKINNKIMVSAPGVLNFHLKAFSVLYTNEMELAVEFFHFLYIFFSSINVTILKHAKLPSFHIWLNMLTTIHSSHPLTLT